MLSVDIEEWFQTENFHGILPRDKWDCQESRIERSTQEVLATLARYGHRATFFVLGCVAAKQQSLVKTIAQSGHEIACHGYAHELIYRQTQNEFREDVRRAKALLEDLTGVQVFGYRAPAYSITEWSLDILRDEGFAYDSSLFPVSYHDRYGSIRITDLGRQIVCLRDDFLEVTVSTLDVFGRRLPWAGGGYFRLLPYGLFSLGVQRILNQRGSYLFYFHPPEIDPGQPVMPGLGPALRFRQYVGLRQNARKLRALLSAHEFVPISTGIGKLGYSLPASVSRMCAAEGRA